MTVGPVHHWRDRDPPINAFSAFPVRIACICRLFSASRFCGILGHQGQFVSCRDAYWSPAPVAVVWMRGFEMSFQSDSTVELLSSTTRLPMNRDGWSRATKSAAHPIQAMDALKAATAQSYTRDPYRVRLQNIIEIGVESLDLDCRGSHHSLLEPSRHCQRLRRGQVPNIWVCLRQPHIRSKTS